MCHPTGPERSAGRAERVDTPAVPQLPHPRRSMAPSIDQAHPTHTCLRRARFRGFSHHDPLTEDA